MKIALFEILLGKTLGSFHSPKCTNIKFFIPACYALFCCSIFTFYVPAVYVDPRTDLPCKLKVHHG